MTTRLTTEQRHALQALQARAPWLRTLAHGAHLPTGRPPTTVDEVLAWLSLYLTHVEKQAAKIEQTDRARARAEIVLRGLRQDLANVASTLDDLDAEVDAHPSSGGRLDDPEIGTGRDEAHIGAYGVGPYPFE